MSASEKLAALEERQATVDRWKVVQSPDDDLVIVPDVLYNALPQIRALVEAAENVPLAYEDECHPEGVENLQRFREAIADLDKALGEQA